MTSGLGKDNHHHLLEKMNSYTIRRNQGLNQRALQQQLLQGQKEPILINLDDSQVSIGTEEPVISTPSSSTSHNLLEITQSAGASEIEDSNVVTNFLEIKQKNEALKDNVRSQMSSLTSFKSSRRMKP